MLRDVEDEILRLTGNRYEMIVVLDGRGQPIYQRLGTSAGVAVGELTVRRLRGRAHVITHNHPLGTPMSDADVALAIAMDAQEVHAFDASVRWRLVRRGTHWPSADTFVGEIRQLASHVVAALQAEVDAGEIDVEEGERQFYGRLWPLLERRRPAWFTFIREAR